MVNRRFTAGLKAAGQRLIATESRVNCIARLLVNVLEGWLIKIFTLYLQKHIIDVI